MNKAELTENLMEFVTQTAKNVLTLAKNCKDIEDVEEMRKEVLIFSLNFSCNLKTLTKLTEKEEQNGSTEH